MQSKLKPFYHLSLMSLTILIGGVGLASDKASLPAVKKPSGEVKNHIPGGHVEELVKNFMFIGDFEQKSETRNIGTEIFWRYPTTMPKIGFAISTLDDLDDPQAKIEFPQTMGAGRPVEHLNLGRISFLRGDFEDARVLWLGGRQRYRTKSDFHRRSDYFLSQAYLYKAVQKLRSSGMNFDDNEVKVDLTNASKFMMWAFDKKKDLPDTLLDLVSPRAFYNLAAVYFAYKRWPSSSGATRLGLDFLRANGRTEYRKELQFINAEVSIANRDYLEAFRQLDLAMRQQGDLDTAAHVFSRIGDMYFDLNNFELAEEVYGASARIDAKLNTVRPLHFVLRGEALFWLGKYNEAHKLMEYALQANNFPGHQQDLRIPSADTKVITEKRVIPTGMNSLDINMAALASMRIADVWMALKEFDKAKIAYFKHANEFRNHVTATYAQLRLACLELPYYEGHNIGHARKLLVTLKEDPDVVQHKAAQELAWTCEMASYAQHERNPEMVNRVRNFADQYPNSDLLKRLIGPLREVQSRNIQDFFVAKDDYGAIDFFEKTRSSLYPTVSDDLAKKIFVSYVDTGQSGKSEEFMNAYEKTNLDDFSLLRLATAVSEIGSLSEGKDNQNLAKKNKNLANELNNRILDFKAEDRVRLFINRIMETKFASDHYPWIMKVGMKWGEKDISTACDMVYPLLQKSKINPGEMGTALVAQKFIEKNLLEMIKFETNCAYSLMEYELSLYRGKTKILAKIYKDRTYIPLNSITSNIIWNIAESCNQEGERESAVQLWTYLVDKGSPDLPEVRYARARLDDRRTELENLWGK